MSRQILRQSLGTITRSALMGITIAVLAGCAATGVRSSSASDGTTTKQPIDASAGMTATADFLDLDYAGAQGLELGSTSGTTGVASYYGSRFAGQRTASGERFNPSELTAAHRTLPFGTRVLVTNLANNRHVTVRINDRGPFVGSRVIDLSRRAAQRIGMIDAGTARVRLRILNN